MNWICVSDRLPDDGVNVLLRAPFITFVGRKRYGNIGEPNQDIYAWRCVSSGRYTEGVTHWQPLPPPPDDKH